MYTIFLIYVYSCVFALESGTSIKNIPFSQVYRIRNYNFLIIKSNHLNYTYYTHIEDKLHIHLLELQFYFHIQDIQILQLHLQ